MSFPRLAFSFPTRTPSWFAGHMVRSLRELPALLDEVDVVLEARDARLPLSSANPAFDALLERAWGHSGAGVDRRGKGKEKIIVYTKRDLAEERYEVPLRKAFWAHARQRVLFADSRQDADARAVLRQIARSAHANAETSTDLKVLVVGMPNVGKSSLLNALRRVGVRKGKAFITGAEPGVTRRLTGTVKIIDEPPVYVYDTPGVMVPYLGNGPDGAERGLKLALTAGIKDGLFEHDVVADYLLYKMNLRLWAESNLAPDDSSRHSSYTTSLPLPAHFARTDSLVDLLDALAGRLGALRRGGEPDTDASLAYFIRAFREGKLGRWTLDDVDGFEKAVGAGPAPIADDAEHTELGATAGASSFFAIPDPVDTSLPLPAQASQPSLLHPVVPPLPLPSDLPPAVTVPTSLVSRVSTTVAQFLSRAEQERIDADAGRNTSTSQRRKAELRAKADHRLARARALGLDKRPSSWSQSRASRPRRRR